MHGRKDLFVLALLLTLTSLATSVRALQTPSCGDGALAPIPSRPDDGSLLFRVNNTNLPVSLRMCVFDATGTKRIDVTDSSQGNTVFLRREAIPAGRYDTRIEARDPGSDDTIVAAFDSPNTLLCPTGAAVVPTKLTRDGDGRILLETEPWSCDLDPTVPPVHQNSALPPPMAAAARPTVQHRYEETQRQILVWGFGLGGFALLISFPGSRVWLLGLFSRLVQHKVLEQPTRAQILALITHDPGIHLREVANTLEIGAGATQYHVGILRRHRLIYEMRRGKLRCLFPGKMQDPKVAQAAALLREERTDAVYQAVVGRPGASVGELANATRLRASSVSKTLDRLEKVGLVRRTRRGRQTIVDPRNGPDSAQ